jgi:hypothetical protein
MSDHYRKSSALVALIVGAACAAGAASAQTAQPAAPAANAPAATVADAPAATVADAPAAKPAVKPHRKTTPIVVVLVTNSRKVALTELDAVAAGGGAEAKQIVANLAPGKKTSVKVPHGKSCVFDLHGAYADGSSTDSASVDLCKDKNVNLVE